MNNSARRDGTPDRRKRGDQPQRPVRGAGAARRGTERSSAPRGNAQGGNTYRGSAAQGGGSYRDRAEGGNAYRGRSEGGSTQNNYRGGSTQGGNAYRGRPEAGPAQGSSYRGTRDNAQGNTYRPRSEAGSGGNAYRGRSENNTYRPRSEAGSGGNAYRGPNDSVAGRDNAQSGNSYRAQSGSAQGRGPAQPGIPQRRAAQPAPTGKKKTPKPQRQTPSAPLLNNAKPARRQHVEPAASEGHVKMPWGEGERLQKVLAKAGVASRRAAEEMIAQGRVEVDGAIVVEQGLRIDPQTAVVRVDGTRVMVREELVHIVLNKPKGWQSTMSDDLGRPCVGDIVAERIAAGQRLFHVGRLDADTEGLLLLTNDGDLAHRLMHPSYEVSKTYLATVNGEVHKSIGKKLRDGIELEDGPAKVDSFQVLELGEGRSLVKLVLHEGRKHIVRRLLDAVGHPVTRLVRTNIGPVALGDQRPGTLRVLGRGEIGKLYEAVSL
ncbi:pseudouridine synthase [Nocardia tenerifensis]|uniref:Pseudouridine synthase n=1 Tax=Nocardia tenerifensis TaxID=228006 RepID=A0A318JUZ5_9NOCA|nr:pseudouridine synthase [Nocardia tenerifensis]PXX60841.1 pseudouridine synthase [Nocardia tenerifensis]